MLIGLQEMGKVVADSERIEVSSRGNFFFRNRNAIGRGGQVLRLRFV